MRKDEVDSMQLRRMAKMLGVCFVFSLKERSLGNDQVINETFSNGRSWHIVMPHRVQQHVVLLSLGDSDRPF